MWRLVDGKPGHDNQTLGLVRALQRIHPTEVFDIPVDRGSTRAGDFLRRRFPAGELLPDPWLLVGAGRATQLPLLQARRARGGRAVVLMTPGLPQRWFDLCVIPVHDEPVDADNVLATRGCLNTVQRRAGPGRRHGLVLLGGPSRHFRWDSGAVIEQVLRVIRFSSTRRWILATTRRTPPGLAWQVRQQLYDPGREIEVASWRDTGPDWLNERLAQASCAWVTADSVSMVYEVLTAGVSVGLLELAPRRSDRVVRGIAHLVAERYVMPFRNWAAGTPLRHAAVVFNEAERTAQWIFEQWGDEAAPR